MLVPLRAWIARRLSRKKKPFASEYPQGPFHPYRSLPETLPFKAEDPAKNPWPEPPALCMTKEEVDQGVEGWVKAFLRWLAEMDQWRVDVRLQARKLMKSSR